MDAPPTLAPTDDHPVGGELNAALTRAVVSLYRAHAGRGPTRARAFFRDDVLVVVLRDVLTIAERSLVDNGRADAVRALRRELQASMRPDIVAAVESLTGATVIAALSDSNVDPDVAVEVFLLDRPVGHDAGLADGRHEVVAGS